MRSHTPTLKCLHPSRDPHPLCSSFMSELKPPWLCLLPGDREGIPLVLEFEEIRKYG